MSGAAPAPPEPKHRLFFALWPDDAQRTALADAARAALADCRGGAVPAHTLHATLAFLGSVPGSRLAELNRIGADVSGRFARESPLLQLQFTELAYWSRPQILVALAPQAEAVAALAALLRSALLAAGFRPDLKAFHAHVTLARKVPQDPQARLANTVCWSLAAFALIESQSDARGVAYSTVQSYLLVDAQKAHTPPRN